MTWNEILHIEFTSDFGISAYVGPALIGIFLLIAMLRWIPSIAKFLKYRCSEWDVVQAEIKLGGIGSVSIKPNYDTIRIAHKVWVELVTRKAALPFDEEHDVIIEVYKSWYELFREIRMLAKDIPAEKIRKNNDTQKLVHLLVDTLNRGLRPHLTKWQAKFRRWYESYVNTNSMESPQDIQKKYPYYAELVAELRVVNEGIMEYAKFIETIAYGDELKKTS